MRCVECSQGQRSRWIVLNWIQSDYMVGDGERCMVLLCCLVFDPVMHINIFATHDSKNDDNLNLPRSLRIERCLASSSFHFEFPFGILKRPTNWVLDGRSGCVRTTMKNLWMI